LSSTKRMRRFQVVEDIVRENDDVKFLRYNDDAILAILIVVSS
jgi:hypothetical protein